MFYFLINLLGISHHLVQGLLVSALLLSPSLLIIFISPPLPSHSILHHSGRTVIPAAVGHNSLFKGSREKVKYPCYKKQRDLPSYSVKETKVTSMVQESEVCSGVHTLMMASSSLIGPKTHSIKGIPCWVLGI